MGAKARPLPSSEYLNSILHYNCETGELVWKVGRPGVKAWTTAGSNHCKGYRNIRIDGVLYLTHRLAFKMFWNLEREQIDHINRNKEDNSIDNLRATDNTKNQWNREAKGCYQHAGKWKAQIRVDGKVNPLHLGYFDTEQEAIDAYQAIKQIVHPEY